MAIDPSIPLQANRNQINPLASVGQVAQLSGNLLQQRALGQQIQANVAASRAFKEATNPQTGQVDYNRLTSLLAGSPAAYNLPQIQGQLTEQQLRRQQLDTSQYELAHQRLQQLGGSLASLATKPDLSADDVVGEARSLVQSGVLDPQQTAAYLSGMPSDPNALRGWLKQHALSVMDAKDAVAASMPTVQAIGAGNRTELINTNPNSQVPYGDIGTIQNGLSPDAASQPVTIFDPTTGAPKVTTRAQLVGAVQGSLPSVGGSGYTGRYPGAVTGGPHGALPGLQAGPSLGQAAGAEVAAKGGADRFNALQSSAGDARNSIQGYDRALQIVDQTRTGPGSSSIADLGGVLTTLGVPIGKSDAENYQSLNKYLANAAGKAAEQAGFSGSDARVSAFFSGQPNAQHMNADSLKEAIQYVKAQQLGVLAKSSAEQQFIQANNNDYTKIPQFETQWNKAYDPEAMYFMSLDPGQQASYVQKLSPADRKALTTHIQQMDQIGAFGSL